MKIVLIGAYGYTARLIAELLHQNQILFSIAGRDFSKSELLKKEISSVQEIIQIDLTSANDVEKLVAGFDFFINCAGPFTEESSLLVDRIAEAQHKIYLDITGESEFVRNSFEKRNLTAEKNHTLIIHGCAFESAIAEMGLALSIKPDEKIQTCNSYYSFAHSKPSPGTRMTMKLSKFRTFHKIQNGNWELINLLTDRVPVKTDASELIAIPYPLPEIAFFYNRFHVKNALTYLLLKKEEALLSGSAPEQKKDLKSELDKLKVNKPKGPSPSERAAQKFELILEIKASEKTKFVSISGSDMYSITAQLILILTQKLSESKTHVFGVVSPGKICAGTEAEIFSHLHISIDEKNGFRIPSL